MDDIDAGLTALVTDIRRPGIASIAVPPLGCGLGGLSWAEVRPKIERAFAGLIEPFVTLLEVHKLLYFTQEAGESLRLSYVKAPYGPYAENLRHVLRHIEGHLVVGYADGGDAPDKQLELVPGAIDVAMKFLADCPPTRAHFDRVAALVEGFETPFGMELLATVHWVATREAVETPEAATQHVYRWNERKRRSSERQIHLAWDVLTSEGWIGSAAPGHRHPRPGAN